MIGNILAITNSASNENIEVDDLLKKGLYNGNASDLKSEIDKKVSQEAGKGLSSNDYTNEEKRKNEENTLKRVANITVTGDVNKIITITFADSTVMQAPFKDNDHIPLADVNMNSLNFNENTGVLTGVKSDGNKISVSLDGRYSLIGHNHDEQYSPKTHTHSEYAPSSHRHNWDDIDSKPNNLATTENIKKAVEEIKIGGRNYIVGSNVVINSAYNQTMRMSNELIAILNSVRLVTVSVYIEYSKLIALGNRRLGYEFVITYTDNSKHYVHAWKPVSEADLGGSYAGRFSLTHALHNGKTIQSITSTGLHIQCTAENVKLGLPKVEIGNKPTDWSPAPEDFGNPVYYQNITNAHTFLNRDSSVHIGSGANITNAPSTHYYEMVGFTHSSKNWGFIIAKNIDVDDKCLYVKQVIGGTYKDWFKIKEYDPVGNIINGTRQILPNEADKVIFITNSVDNCALNVFPDKCSVSFRKTFDGGYVNFTCLGKNIIYSDGIQNFDGKKGSTATVSIFENDCYIDIRNV